jgi:hypothetical protein
VNTDTLPDSLVHFESQLEDAIGRYRRNRPRRIAFRASAACAAAAVGLGMFTLWPAKDAPPASAIEQAKAVLTQAGGIQHVIESTDITRPDGARETMGSETWSLTTPPHDERQTEFRNGEVRFEGGSAGDRPEFYDPRTNTVHVLPDDVEVPVEAASPSRVELSASDTILIASRPSTVCRPASRASPEFRSRRKPSTMRVRRSWGRTDAASAGTSTSSGSTCTVLVRGS